MGEDYTNFGETNYAPYIAKVMAAKPDCLSYYNIGAGWTRVIKQARQMGFTGHINHGYWQYKGALAVGDAVLGMTAWDHIPKENPEVPRAKIFTDAFKEKFGSYPGGFAGNGFIGVELIMEAVKAAGTTDTEAVIDTMESMVYKNLIHTPKFYFRKADHLGMGTVGYFGKAVKHPKYTYNIEVTDQFHPESSPFMTPEDKTGCEEFMKRRK